MLVAVWTVHVANGFFLNWTMTPGQGHGYEFNLVLVGALVSLMLTGPGALSFDQPSRERRGNPGLRARAGCEQAQV